MEHTSHIVTLTRCLPNCRAPSSGRLHAPHRDLELVRSTRCRRESAWKVVMRRCLPVRIVFPSIRCTPATESTPQNPPPPLAPHRRRQNTRISGLKTAMSLYPLTPLFTKSTVASWPTPHLYSATCLLFRNRLTAKNLTDAP